MNLRLNLAQVGRVLAALLGFMALFMAVPGIIAALRGNLPVAWAFWGPALGTLGAAGLGVLIIKPKSEWIGPRESYLLVTAAWVLVSLIGALPYFLSGAIPNYTDAFFETMSGFTTTGASILKNIEALDKALLFWRALTHWLGGMGIIVLTVAILPLLGVNGLALMRAESPGPDVDKVTPRLTSTAKVLWLIYVGMTVLQVILLMLGGMTFFDATTHSFATMATGGFSTRNASLAAWDSPYIHWVVTIFMLLAGVNFVLYFRALRGNFKVFAQNTEFKVYMGICLVATLLLTGDLFLRGQYNLADSLRHGAFQMASIITTTGFASADYALWPVFSQGVLFLLFFVGGCTGSTGGGMKVLRLTLVGRLAYHEARYMLHPRGVACMRLNGSRINKQLFYPAAGFVALYLAIALGSTMVVAIEGRDLISSFSTVMACLGNVGPGFGAVGPVENYAGYSDAMTWFLSIVMLMGRLELYTVIMLILPVYWRR